MSMTLAEARDAVAQIATKADAVLVLRDVLEAAGVAESRASILAEQIGANQAALDDLTRKMAEAHDAAEAVYAAADAALKQARVDADAIVTKARNEADRAVADGAAQMAALDEMFKTKSAALAAASAAVDAKSAELADVEARLTAANEARRKIIAGE